MQNTIPTKLALNYAVQAHYKNGKYLKNDQYEYKNTDEGSTEVCTAKANKNIMKEMFDNDIFPNTKYNDYTDEVFTHFQGLVFKMMSNTANDFDTSVYKILSKEMVTRSELGYLAPLPAFYETHLKRQTFMEEIVNSKFLGRTGEKITVRAVLHEARYIASRDFTVYTFISEGNLISHFSNKRFNEWADVGVLNEGNEYTLSFKVKRHQKSKFYNCNETMVNYLKVTE
tara:strand:- start:1461 stop:2144 length:684 start_codon:yes stop_codon:yes gene_type:complete